MSSCNFYLIRVDVSTVVRDLIQPVFVVAAARSPRQVRGKRKLQFDPQPFRGKTIFLDLPGYKHVKELEQQLTARGAVSHCMSN